jgi:hypothetical protein
MVPPTLNIKTGQSLYRTYLNGELLEVREYNNYRWFHYGGDVVQVAIDTFNHENILLQVPQSLLLFLLWQKPPFHLLNLGMVAGTIENALHKLSDIKVTSVEAELPIIEMAKRYFFFLKKIILFIKMPKHLFYLQLINTILFYAIFFINSKVLIVFIADFFIKICMKGYIHQEQSL